MTLMREDIEFLYQSLLLRQPENQEIEAWLRASTAGDVSLRDLRVTIVTSVEMGLYVEPVIRLYQALLGRVPDPPGLELHVNLLRSGLGIADLVHAVLISPEYEGLHKQSLPLELPIARLYQSLLGRTGSATEIQAWIDTGKPFEAILLGFLQSDEFIQRCADGVARFLNEIAAGTEHYLGTLFSDDAAKSVESQDNADNQIPEIITQDGVSNGNETGGVGSASPTNTAPVAHADSYALDEDTVLQVDAASGVLANDSDAEAGTLRVILATGPSHGSVTLNADGSFIFKPVQDHSGTDHFTYTLADGEGGTAIGTVSLSLFGKPDLTNITGHGDGSAFEAAMAARTGIVVFTSDASALVSGEDDTNQGTDLFRYDDHARSLTSITAGANSYSYNPDISADGSRVVFVSNATNLVPDQEDTNPNDDIFLFDAHEQSITNLTAGADSYSLRPDISADGARIVFISNATNLVPGETDSNGAEDVFLYDTNSETFLNLTHGANAASYAPRISADGERVVFISNATNLIPSQSTGNGTTGNLFLFDVAAHQMRNLTPGANGEVESFDLSADGNLIVFASTATNLVAGETDKNEVQDVFLYDALTQSLTNITVTGDEESRAPVIAADGSRIVFSSKATNLVPGEDDENAAEDLFIYDIADRTLRNLTWGGDGDSQNARLSASGDTLVFTSKATNLIEEERDANGEVQDIFLYDFNEETLRNLTPAADEDSELPLISDRGLQVLFVSAATNLIDGQVDPNGTRKDLFFFEF
jgi:Tol biopolymer transport system component